jgi:hypothetical protein
MGERLADAHLLASPGKVRLKWGREQYFLSQLGQDLFRRISGPCPLHSRSLLAPVGRNATKRLAKELSHEDLPWIFQHGLIHGPQVSLLPHLFLVYGLARLL